jgi:hypothetical protein
VDNILDEDDIEVLDLIVYKLLVGEVVVAVDIVESVDDEFEQTELLSSISVAADELDGKISLGYLISFNFEVNFIPRFLLNNNIFDNLQLFLFLIISVSVLVS